MECDLGGGRLHRFMVSLLVLLGSSTEAAQRLG